MIAASRLPAGRWQASTPGGDDSIDTVTSSRWDLEVGRTGSSQPRARFGGWLQAIDTFDSSAFSITAPEADLMDPQQRLLLEVRLSTFIYKFIYRSINASECWASGQVLKAEPLIQRLGIQLKLIGL